MKTHRSIRYIDIAFECDNHIVMLKEISNGKNKYCINNMLSIFLSIRENIRSNEPLFYNIDFLFNRVSIRAKDFYKKERHII